MKQSPLESHPHIRNLIYGAAILFALAALGAMFGWDEVRMFGREVAATFGLIEVVPK